MPVTTGAAILGLGSSILGGVAQGSAAQSAAKAQGDAANATTALQERIYNQQRADQEPFRQVGLRALAGLEDPSFQKEFQWQGPGTDNVMDPGYQFRLQEGQKAINAAAAARGMANSGATLKALQRYGQEQASNEYQNAFNRFNTNQTNRFNRLSSLAGIGQTANSQIAQAGQNYGNQASSNILGAGNAAAAGSVATGNAFNDALSGGYNNWVEYQYMKKKGYFDK